MKWFKDMSVARKQLLGVAASVLLTILLGVLAHAQITSSNQQIQRVVQNQMPSVRAIAETFAWISELRTNELVLLQDRDYEAALEGFRFARDGAHASNELYQSLLTDDSSRELYAAVDPLFKAYMQGNEAFLAAAQAGDYDAAAVIATETLQPLRLKMFDALNGLKHNDDRLLQQELEASAAAFERSIQVITGLTIAASVLALGFGLLLARMIGRALGRAKDISAAIASGNFDSEITVDSRDEIGQLLESMRVMQQSLQRFTGAQHEMCRQHAAGELDFRMDPDDFSGSYREMAERINELVSTHIAVQARVVDVVARYGRGDLSVDMDRLPGRQARITEAVDAVKEGMQRVNSEIAELVDAAVAGDFSRRGDAEQFEFVYRDAINGLNTLMATAHSGLGEVGELLTAVSEGELRRRADETLPGQFGQLAADANRTVEKLAQIVGQIRQGSDTINAAAGEIAAGNADLSRRTEQQAASLEETASSMEELTSTVQHNADNARAANQLARGAAEVAGQGGEVVGRVVRTMDEINEASRRIVDIISVIDGIAFQTNILALNAAVEAARAGEQGRGFAVVASEVRSLAQRSAAAAKEIKVLIDDSVARVDTGSELVSQAGRTMDEIVTSVAKVTEIMSEIAAASAEQSAGIEQVSQAVVQMDEGTQQNAALVEQASAAARSLEQQAGGLVQTVAIFRIEGGRSDLEGFERHLRESGAVPAVPAPVRSPQAHTDRAANALPAGAGPSRRVAAGGDAHWQEF
ncbi:methyl-accepting chemotaxis protein [Novilysobacter defluvii]